VTGLTGRRARVVSALAGALLPPLLLMPDVAVGETISVKVSKLAFSPAAITAKVDDTIEWTNTDFVTHTATATDKSFDISLPADQAGSVVVKNEGTFPYFCRVHPMMKGTITVTK
jgi:plastocyanin